MAKVTAADLQRVARHICVHTNRTVVMTNPSCDGPEGDGINVSGSVARLPRSSAVAGRASTVVAPQQARAAATEPGGRREGPRAGLD